MSVIQREIERAGIATVSVSLVKEFTQKVRPPRALWVPFPFGRPLGAPGNARVQRQVLMRAFGLLSSKSGPVLEEFELAAEDERLDARYQALGRTCGPKGCSLGEMFGGDDDVAESIQETLYGGNLSGVLEEIAQLQPAHRRYRQERKGRTSVGASGRTPENIAEAARSIHAFVSGQTVRRTTEHVPGQPDEPSESLFVRLSIDDLKAFYLESRVETAPQDTSDAARSNDWFWLETWAGRMIIAARDRLVEVTDRVKDPNWIVARAIVPRGYGKSGYSLDHVVHADAGEKGLRRE